MILGFWVPKTLIKQLLTLLPSSDGLLVVFWLPLGRGSDRSARERARRRAPGSMGAEPLPGLGPRGPLPHRERPRRAAPARLQRNGEPRASPPRRKRPERPPASRVERPQQPRGARAQREQAHSDPPAPVVDHGGALVPEHLIQRPRGDPPCLLERPGPPSAEQRRNDGRRRGQQRPLRRHPFDPPLVRAPPGGPRGHLPPGAVLLWPSRSRTTTTTTTSNRQRLGRILSSGSRR